MQYAYDSQNKRIWKGTYTSGNLTAQEVYFYGVDGQKLGTYSLILNYGTGQPLYLADPNTTLAVYFGGKRVAVNGTAFVQDRLGSNTQGKYYPYGEDRGTPAPNDQVKFATYTRDSATGLDYADQRYYSNQFGRFMTVDSGKVRPTNPLSWNRYAYSGNDPINHYDPAGLDWWDPNTNTLHGDAPSQITPIPILPGPPDGYLYNIGNGLADLGQLTSQIGANIATAMWVATTQSLQDAATYIAGDESMWAIPDCARDLESITGELGTAMAGRHLNSSQITAAADAVNFNNASTTGYAPPGFVGPVLPAVNSPIWGGPGTYAISYFNTNQQYWLPGSTIMAPGGTSFMTPGRLDGMVLHELLHNLGYSDADIQSSLGIAVSPLDTDNISRALTTDCFR